MPLLHLLHQAGLEGQGWVVLKNMNVNVRFKETLL
jgi:hypothetical protein